MPNQFGRANLMGLSKARQPAQPGQPASLTVPSKSRRSYQAYCEDVKDEHFVEMEKRMGPQPSAGNPLLVVSDRTHIIQDTSPPNLPLMAMDLHTSDQLLVTMLVVVSRGNRLEVPCAEASQNYQTGPHLPLLKSLTVAA